MTSALTILGVLLLLSLVCMIICGCLANQPVEGSPPDQKYIRMMAFFIIISNIFAVAWIILELIHTWPWNIVKLYFL